jgi:hypothetical protein
MLKPVLIGASLALAALALPVSAQDRAPSPPAQPGQAPAQRNMGAITTLSLTQEEQHVVLQNVEKSNASDNGTMGLGALQEGAAVPQGMKTQKFNEIVVSKIPKLAKYSYVTAENKLLIIEPMGGKIAMVLDQNSPQAK